MRTQSDVDQGALRVLMSAMSGMVALALLFFMAPFAGIGLLLAAIVGVPTVMWLRSRRAQTRRRTSNGPLARIFR